MGFFSAVKKIFGGSRQDENAPQPSDAADESQSSEIGAEARHEPETAPAREPGGGAALPQEAAAPVSPASEVVPEPAPTLFEEKGVAGAPAPASGISGEDEALTLRLREAEPRLSIWLGIILEDVDGVGDLLWQRLAFLLHSLDAPQDEVQAFVRDFQDWLERMEYRYVEEFRSELQYRLALALDLEDEEDERSRLFLKISEGLSRTREQFARRLDTLFAGHGELDEQFWEELEELFIMADLGYEPSLELVERLKERARREKATRAEQAVNCCWPNWRRSSTRRAAFRP